MKKNVIAIDCDDVIIETAPDILRYYKNTYGVNIELKNFYSTDPKVWGVTDHAVAIERVTDYFLSTEFRALEPLRETIDAVGRLSARYQLHVVTGRSDALAPSTVEMLNRNFPDIFTSIQFTNFHNTNHRSKATVCRELGASYLIDDHIHHATVVAECGIDVLLFGIYPWNELGNLPVNIRRVHDWREIERLLLP